MLDIRLYKSYIYSDLDFKYKCYSSVLEGNPISFYYSLYIRCLHFSTVCKEQVV